MANIQINSLTLVQNSQAVSVDDVQDFSDVQEGWILSVNGIRDLPLKSGGNQTLTLVNPFDENTLTAVKGTIVVTNVPLQEAIDYTRKVGDKTIELSTTQEEMFTSDQDFITYVDRREQVHQISTAHRLESVINEAEGLTGSIQAMDKASFESRHELKPAGFLTFDNSLTDVNFGISTPATTSNQFTLGASSVLVNKAKLVLGSTDIVLPAAPDGLDKSNGAGRYADLAEAITAGGNALTESIINALDFTIVRMPVLHKNVSTSNEYYVNGNADSPIQDWLVADQPALLQNPDNNLYSDNGNIMQATYDIFTHRLDLDSLVDISALMPIELYAYLAQQIGAVWDSEAKAYKYTSDSVEYYIAGITATNRRNQQAYHPVYNESGCALFTDGNWYTSALSINSVADCVSNANVNSGAIGQSSGHKSGLFYDAIYASDVIDLRYDISGNWTLQRFNDWMMDCAKDGTCSDRSFEYVPFTGFKQYTTRTGAYDGYNINIANSTRLGIQIGEEPNPDEKVVAVKGVDGTWYKVALGGYADGNELGGTHRIVYLDPVYGDVRANFTVANPEVMYEEKSKVPSRYWTDIIGTPANIKATFPDGVYGAWIPALPDGSFDDFPLNRKGLHLDQRIYTVDNGVNWLVSTSTGFNSTNNTIQGQPYSPEYVGIYSYKYAPHFTVPADQPSVDYINRDVYATNYSTVQGGVTLCDSLLNKVSISTTHPAFANVNLTEWRLDTEGKMHWWAAGGYVIANDTLNLANADSPAVKCFGITELEDNSGHFYLNYKEMVFDSGADSAGDFISVNGTSSQVYTSGNTYNITNLDQRTVVRCIASVTGFFNDLTKLANGDYISSDGVVRFETWNGNGFGDNNKFDIANGNNFGTDLNGNSYAYGCAECKPPQPIYIPQTIAES